MLVIVTKKIVAAVALCMMSAVSVAEVKIAILNPSAAIQGTAVAKAKFEKMSKSADYAATKAKLDGITTDAKALQASAEKENATWTAEKKAEVQKKLESLSQDYQFNGKKLQAAQQEMGQQLTQEMGPKLQVALKEIVEAEKIDIVLDSQGVYHASPAHDITAKVTELLNKAK